MNDFLITLVSVAVMLAYAVPGFIFVKSKLIGAEHTVIFSKLLLYFCQPCLTFYSFQNVITVLNSGSVSHADMYKNILIFLALASAILVLFIALGYLLLHKKYKNVSYRIFTVAIVFANFGYFGLPIIEDLMPTHPEAVVYSTIFSFVMNVIGWTVAAAIITGDKKYISFKKAFLAPTSIAVLVALPFLFFEIGLPAKVDSMIKLIGQFSTPLCMIIMGMRLATVKPSELLLRPVQYAVVAAKNIAVPLVAFVLVFFLPIDLTLKKAFFILCACPAATLTLSFSELLHSGQKTAANIVLISTIASLITMPTLLLLLSYL